MLRDLALKAVYRTDEDNILEDFYVPCLRNTISYDRAVGFFSAGMLSYAAQGLSAFLENDGRMRLIIGGELDPLDAEAISQGYDLRAAATKLGRKIIETIDGVTDALFFRRVEALAWLIASGRLDVKVALKRRGMYHEKIGVLRDAAGDRVVFQGSANETTSALLPDFNFESINVFVSWRPELSDHFVPHIEGFERLWDNKIKNTVVLDFPEAARERLVKVARAARLPRPEVEIELWQKLVNRDQPQSSTMSEPRLPLTFNGKDFEIMPHQREALVAWRSNDLRGVLALATGAGKTITAIYGAIRIYEQAKRLFFVISVPYQNLADQWVATLREFNISAIQCYGSAAQWTHDLAQCVTLFQTRAMPFVCAVVVNRTLQSEGFRRQLSQIPGDYLFWVGDECHHHGTENLASCLPSQARFRIGLSATPEHYIDQAATARLIDFYGNVVARYGLAEALRDKVLTPYRYYLTLVDLNESESADYAEISEQISRLAVQRGAENVESSGDEQLKMLLFRRARLLGAAANKLPALRSLISDSPPTPLTLFYCGDGRTEEEDTGETVRQIEAVSALLHEHGWKSMHFTSRETRQERQQILDFFRLGLVDAMVAIRCLDEGIDVPACRTAYILASSRNPKQFIQRRGRILRRAPGKDRAEIYDFLVKVPEDTADDSPHERQLLIGEIKRVAEFARLAENAGDAFQTLAPLLDQYDLHHYLV